MTLTFIDWAIIAAYFLISLAIGLYDSRRAGKDVGEYFLFGRNLPWWLAGTSMVATTFAADTPLAVAGFVARSRVRPGGPGWGPIARRAGGPPPEAIGGLVRDWIAAGC